MIMGLRGVVEAVNDSDRSTLRSGLGRTVSPSLVKQAGF